MKSHSFRTKAQHSHVLNKNGINTCFSQIAEHLFHIVQFFLVKDGIDRHIYLDIALMGVFDGFRQSIQRKIIGKVSQRKGLKSHINRVRAIAYRCLEAFHIPRRGKKFHFTHHQFPQ